MKLALASILLFSALPAQAGGPTYHRNGYVDRTCYETRSYEQYIPGDRTTRGYIHYGTERVEVPCRWRYRHRRPYHHHDYHHPDIGNDVDDNSCIEGAVLGGIAGGGAGAVLSRGDGRWWAIPLGIVSGSMVGCQVDGG